MFADAYVAFRQTAHDKVKRKALSLIAMWTEDFERDASLGIMEECYENLKAKGTASPIWRRAPDINLTILRL